MGTVSVDLRAVDRGERRTLLGGSSHAAGSSNEGRDSNEQSPVGKDRVRGEVHSAQAEDPERDGGRLQAEDPESYGEILKFAYPKGKHKSGKKSHCKRRVTFAL
ncbi:uncharacterized protein LOC108626697 [Ceratina calcarata]|uniref:Uncharacterized protein LOC108626697 n=1 Tax=Ceratina calcarata TaxID=156304 RepID=A0AAJ7WCY2_9HYME|nr:uncharacterized protein LOC108626697 [Ceratina calcarata]